MALPPTIINLLHNSQAPCEGASCKRYLLENSLRGLQMAPHEKFLPTMLLYDARGLQLFDRITYLDDYYLTNAEMDILRSRMSQLLDSMPHGTTLVELGAGKMRKTKLILDALEARKQPTKFYALDLNIEELASSLQSMDYEYVQVVGLCGDYSDGLQYLESLTASSLVILWLGSSIGNLNSQDSVQFLESVRLRMRMGDKLWIGVDKPNHKEKIELAYNDSCGVTREFILNSILHLNSLLDEPVFDPENFDYCARYNEQLLRHEAFLCSKVAQHISASAFGSMRSIELTDREFIHVEFSYKYSPQKIQEMAHSAGFLTAASWEDSAGMYGLYLLQIPAAPMETVEEAHQTNSLDLEQANNP